MKLGNGGKQPTRNFSLLQIIAIFSKYISLHEHPEAFERTKPDPSFQNPRELTPPYNFLDHSDALTLTSHGLGWIILESHCVKYPTTIISTLWIASAKVDIALATPAMLRWSTLENGCRGVWNWHELKIRFCVCVWYGVFQCCIWYSSK